MANTFFIGDTHFGHRKIITFDAIKSFRPFNTIEEHDAELVRRWNNVVRKQDVVWHLGDFVFGRNNLEIAAQLNGDKRLILGNHDMYPTAEYLKYFTKVCGAVEFQDMVMTHIPVHESQMKRYSHNIHGHLHVNRVQKFIETGWGEQIEAPLGHFEIDSRYINVSAEQINLTPISLDELKAKFL